MLTLIAAHLLLQERVFILEWRRGLISWILIGLMAGWVAGKLSRGAGFGCIGDIVIGLIGSVIGGWIFTRLHIVGPESSFLYSLAAATVGAVVLVFIAHLLFGTRA